MSSDLTSQIRRTAFYAVGANDMLYGYAGFHYIII